MERGWESFVMVTIKSLLEAGVHFGHQTNRWNPKMKPYIFGERNGIYIIDLQLSLNCFQEAFTFVRETVASGESVLFVGTKRQAMDIVEEEAISMSNVFCQSTMAGRHAHQLPNTPKKHRATP